ncbi:MAG TPA: response regulator [Polyangia bacterium]|nr:response regulator [Polyangia bacterium]
MADTGSPAPPTTIVIPVVELGYRTAGAFLASYVTQISQGHIYVEHNAPPPVGSPIVLRLAAPPATMTTLEGTVSFTKPPTGPGQPGGMGIALGPPPESFGATVDRLSSSFTGYRVLLAATEAAPRAILGRYLRSMLTCTVIDHDASIDRMRDDIVLDLAVIDLDSSGPRGRELGERLHQRPRPAPIVALAQMERDRALAQRIGFDEALRNPPAFAELEAAVLRCLARPATTHHSTKYGTLKGYSADD